MIVENRFKIHLSELTDLQIKEFIKKLVVFLGWSMRNVPTEESEKQMLINGIRESIGKWSEDDVFLAIQKALNKEIKYDFKMYDQTLSISFFIGLMTEYSEFIKPAMTKYYSEVNKIPETSQSEIDRKNREARLQLFQNIKSGNSNYSGFHAQLCSFYEFYDKKLFDYTTEEKKEAMQDARHQIINELNVKKAENMGDVKSLDTQNLIDLVLNQVDKGKDITVLRAKALLALQYLRDLIIEEKELSEVI